MKIGILTFHRAHNYGAVLQCYALQEVLKGMGHDVEVIDYRQKWTEEVYKPFSLTVMKVRCKGVHSTIRYIKGLHKRYTAVKKKRASFEAFNSTFLTISKQYCIDELLKSVSDNKLSFLAKCDNLYKDAFEKYKNEGDLQ